VKRRVVSVAIGLLVLNACSLVPQGEAAEPTLHLLDARATVAAGARRDVVLAVSLPRAAAGYDTAAMLYLRRPHALERYATHRWADTPARLIWPLVVRALEDSGGYRAVVTTGSAAPAALRLDTEIVQLRQSFVARPSTVELMLRAQLVDAASRRVLATRVFEIVQPSSSDDAPGGVVAANQAIAAALVQLSAWCATIGGGAMPPS
jgi:cholesterol transport system auxiliary component